MATDFRRWVLAGRASDFMTVTINRRFVVMAQRIKHGANGAQVILHGAAGPIDLTASFDEFDAWLNGENDEQAR